MPTSDEREVSQSGAEGFDTTGVVCDFEGGYIYWHRVGEYKDKGFETHGAIDCVYQKEGGTGGWLGVPISDEYKDTKTGYARSDFEGGYITTTDGINYQAFHYVLPTGKIAFVSDRDGNLEIYLMNTDGTNQIDLTNNPANDWDPVLSPDGKKIAFVSDREGVNKIFIMNAGGSDIRALTEGEDPLWFPDGSKIIFVYLFKDKEFMCGSSKYPLYRLFTINLNGTNKEKFSFAPSMFKKDNMLKKYNFKDPAVSPNGEKIAFSAGNWDCGWMHSIYIVNLKGELLSKYWGEARRGPFDLFTPSWSPDSTKLIFSSYHSHHGGYSSKGVFFNENIEFKWGKYNTELRGKWEPQEYEIWESSETWQDSKKLIQGDYPVWSPSGDKIAYTGEGYNIYIMGSDGSNVKQITNLGRNWDPDWIDGDKDKYPLMERFENYICIS